jgi:hypothetical protein
MYKRTQTNHPWLRKDSWTLWEWWVFATVVGVLVGIGIIAIATIITNTLRTVPILAFLHIVGALEGATLGLAQWLVLRRYIKHVMGWIIATSVGAIATWLIGLQVSVVLALTFFDSAIAETTNASLLIAVFLVGAWIGAALGYAQWFILRTHVRKGIVWVFANSLAWALGLLIAVMGSNLMKSGEVSIENALIGIMTGATTGVVIGAITGITLVWLLRPRLLKHH